MIAARKLRPRRLLGGPPGSPTGFGDPRRAIVVSLAKWRRRTGTSNKKTMIKKNPGNFSEDFDETLT
jgi:hypothetical protein